MAEHKVAEPVLTIPCWGIYADYDANAPDTKTYFLVATEELAKEVCEVLNEDPRSWSALGSVDGWEHSKSFSYRQEFILPEDAEIVFTSLEALRESEHFEQDEDSGDEEDSGDDDGDDSDEKVGDVKVYLHVRREPEGPVVIHEVKWSDSYVRTEKDHKWEPHERYVERFGYFDNRSKRMTKHLVKESEQSLAACDQSSTARVKLRPCIPPDQYEVGFGGLTEGDLFLLDDVIVQFVEYRR